MIRIFQSLQSTAFIAAIAIFMVLQLDTFFFLNEKPLLDIGTFSVFFNYVNTFPVLSRLINATFVLIGAFMLNGLVVRHAVLYKSTALTFLFYLLFACLVPEFSFFNTFTVLNFLSILLLKQIIVVYDNREANYEVFKAAIIIGLGGMFHISFFFTVLFLLFGITRFMPLSPRLLIIILIGAIFPYVFAASVLYAYPSFDSYVIFNNYRVNISHVGKLHWIIFIPFALLLLVSALTWLNNAQRNTVKVRRTIQIILVYVLLALVLSALYWGATWNSLELLQMPSAIVLAYFFTSSKRMKLRNSIFATLLLLILFTQFATHFYLW